MMTDSQIIERDGKRFLRLVTDRHGLIQVAGGIVSAEPLETGEKNTKAVLAPQSTQPFLKQGLPVTLSTRRRR